MSEFGGQERRWDIYIRDMLDACLKVDEFTSGLDQANLLADQRTFDATLFNLALIGEAATKLPEATRDANPEIPWRQIIAMRNRIIHGYGAVEPDLVWAAIDHDVPQLIPRLFALLAETEGRWPAEEG